MKKWVKGGGTLSKVHRNMIFSRDGNPKSFIHLIKSLWPLKLLPGPVFDFNFLNLSFSAVRAGPLPRASGDIEDEIINMMEAELIDCLSKTNIYQIVNNFIIIQSLDNIQICWSSASIHLKSYPRPVPTRFTGDFLFSLMID